MTPANNRGASSALRALTDLTPGKDSSNLASPTRLTASSIVSTTAVRNSSSESGSIALTNSSIRP